MKTFNLLIGIPCSGKSTFSHFLEGKVVSPGDLRKAIYHERFNVEHEGLLWGKIIPDVLNHWVYKGENIIFDATNTTRSSRSNVLRVFNRICDDLDVEYKKVAYYLDTPLDEALFRNGMMSPNDLPDRVIIEASQRITRPLPEEGFDEIVNVLSFKKLLPPHIREKGTDYIFSYVQEVTYP